MKTKKQNKILFLLFIIFSIAITASCGGGSGSSDGGGSGNGGGGGGDSPATVVTGPDGVKLSIPGGSVSQDTTYRIASDSDGAPSTDGLLLLTPIYAVTPHSQSFAEGALIEIPYNVSDVPSGSVPFVLRADAGGQWQAIGDARLANGTAKADISSLSYYAIGVCAQDFSSPGDCPFNSELLLELLDSSGIAIPVQFNSWGQALPVITVDQPTTLAFRVSWWRPPNINRTDNIGLSLSGGGQLSTSPDYQVPPNIQNYELNFNVYIDPATVSGASGPNGKIVRMRASVYSSYLAFVGPPIGFDNIPWEMLTEIAVRVRYNGVQPTITQQPANQAVTAGQTATFSVAASGSPAYLWQRSNDNGQSFSDISGATLASYTTAATALSDNGALFRVQVCSGSACVDSGAAALMVTALSTPPTFTQQPASMAVLVGQTASFTAVAIGPPAPTVQWYKFDGFLGIPVGTPCSSSGNFTSCTYTTPVLALADSGAQYYAVATNSADSVQSNTVTVTVTNTAVAPTITTEPADVSVSVGSNATFSVVAAGTATLSYQWQCNCSRDMTGQNGSSYTLTSAQLSDNGATFNVVVSNTIGSVTSRNAILTVTAAPNYTVGGVVSGLSGTGFVLQNNGGDNLAISSNGAFTFATPVANGSGYAVSVLTYPSGQNCIITNGTGTISGANVTNIAVACSAQSTVTDIDGNVYNTVTIGTQVWMRENLKVTKYRNSESIGTTTPATLDISGEASPKYQWAYDGNESNVATYGRLYTWYAATDSRGLCPTGWHLPTDAEWTTLTDYLGGASVAGGKMKEAGTAYWNSPNAGADNSSGFTALPGGLRGDNGAFGNILRVGVWWSSTELFAPYAWDRDMSYGDGMVSRNANPEAAGFSVRCVKD